MFVRWADVRSSRPTNSQKEQRKIHFIYFCNSNSSKLNNGYCWSLPRKNQFSIQFTNCRHRISNFIKQNVEKWKRKQTLTNNRFWYKSSARRIFVVRSVTESMPYKTPQTINISPSLWWLMLIFQLYSISKLLASNWN